ncbi:MAG: SDR family oxidoreductase [Pseudomonadota bacterium]
MTKKLFIFGYGYTARALARHLRGAADWSVAGTTRSAEKAKSMREDGVEPVIWEGSAVDADELSGATHVLISTPPGEAGCPALAGSGKALAERAGDLQWIGYLSTNGVYGDYDGAWVDETSQLRATSPRGRRRIEAEAAWLAFGRTVGVATSIFRLPGIYGPGRSAIDSVRAGNARRIVKPGQVFSRMHVEDIAATLERAMGRPGLHDIYNLADDEPAPPQDVIEYACELLGVEPPPLIPIDEAEMSEIARSFYADNKRVLNKRIKEALGVALAFPTYREGLRAILAAETA